MIAAAMLMIASARAATIAVTNTNDNLAGSLRQAIQSDSVAGDTIVFQIPTSDPGYNATTNTFTIALTSTSAPGSAIVISKSLIIDGGNLKIIVQRNAAAKFNIFSITAGPVTLSHLTISNGQEESSTGSRGGGISNLGGDLTLNSCTLFGNQGNLGAGAVYNATGIFVANGCSFTSNSGITGGPYHAAGALYLAGEAHISNSTFSGNSAQNSAGAIFHANGLLTVDQCTFAQNTQGQFGSEPGAGAIENAGGAFTINNSTVSVNTAKLVGGIINSSSTPAHARDNIIAGNTVSPDVQGSFVSDGYNFIGVVGTSTGFGISGTHDQVGNSMNPANPMLGPLQDNGGPTLTMRPLAGSPVIDQGNSGGVPADQRGQLRVADQPGVSNAIGGDGSDIGAVEVGLPQTGPTFTVTNASGNYVGSCTNDFCSFVDALTVSNATASNNTINFARGVIGMIPTTFASGLAISNPVTINGPGARALNIVATNPSSNRVFLISASNVAISGLTISGAYLPSSDGGGIYHSSGALALTDCTLANNRADGATGGGGIFNASGTTLTLLRCTLTGNSTDQLGGGVYNDGFFTATNCTFDGDSARNGGGIISRFNSGAATMTLRNCTITNCAATSNGTGTGDGGGGVYAEGSAPQHHVGNSIIAKNHSGGVNSDVRGNFTADTINFIGDVGDSTGLVGLALLGDPRLDTLTNNGGPTDTCALFSDSMARDNGEDNLAPPTDQRGYLRAGTSDIGAFEFNGTLPVLKITSIAHLANGHTTLQGLGVPNTVHTIQAASDPNAGSFSFLGTATSNASGVVLYDDAGSVGLARRFYRLTFP